MIKELKAIITNCLRLSFIVFAISAALTTPVVMLSVVTNYLDGNL
tara:strand:+ start:309 stop:443 length:135 start_codon:yes stop_codon:yes gene_type:complete